MDGSIEWEKFHQIEDEKIFPIQKTEDAHDAEPQHRDDQTKSIVLEIAENATERGQTKRSS